MEKLKSILDNLYNGDNKFMIYIYIAIALVTVVIILVIIISSLKAKKHKNIEMTPPINNNIPPITNGEEVVKTDPLPIKEEEETLTNEEEKAPVIIPVPEEKPVIPEEDKPEIIPLPEEKTDEPIYEKTFELNNQEIDLDLTRPIQRISSATELLNEFVNDESLENTMNIAPISAEELNKPVLEEKVELPKVNQPIFSSVFLDQKTETSNKPKINIELTPIRPLKIDEIDSEKPTTKELFLNPKVLKSENKNILDIKNAIDNKKTEKKVVNIKGNLEENLVKEEPKVVEKEPQIIKEEPKVVEKEPPLIKEEPKVVEKNSKEYEKDINDDSLDTKIDIFKHESLAKQHLNFDPFAPKSQEELLSPVKDNIKKEEVKEKENTISISAEDLKSKLAKIQARIKKEDNEDELLRPIGLDELPDTDKTSSFRR